MMPQIRHLEAMLHCPFKAWQLSKQETAEDTATNPVSNLSKKQQSHTI